MNLVRPIFSITSHLTGKTYDIIQTDAQDGGSSRRGTQVLQVATNDADYFNSQIPNKFTEFVIDERNPNETYREAIVELCRAVQKGIKANVLDAAQTEWTNGQQRSTSGLVSSSRSGGGQGQGQDNGSQASRQDNRNLQLRQLVTN